MLNEHQFATLYHGTSAERVEAIRSEGLRPPSGVNPYAWPMLTTSKDQAARYGRGAVVEYRVPHDEIGVGRTVGPGTEHNVYGFEAQAHGVVRPLGGRYIHEVHDG